METIYVISSKNKWGVYKKHSSRAIRSFKHRDLAFHFATRYNAIIAVMTKDGTPDFIYNPTNEKTQKATRN